MSVKQWKRVITLTVLVTIILLLILTIVFSVRSCHYSSMIHNGQLVDLTEYGEMDASELSGVFRYLSSVNSEDSCTYHDLFPNLYVENDFKFVEPADKTCYLTFDDGPNATNTSAVLDILKEYNIKATFFVVYDTSESSMQLYKRIVNEGHTIGIHTASHNYEVIYSSPEIFLDNFDKAATHIEKVTGVKPNIYRFPGGSINIYNKANYRELITEVIRRGYVYYDWNVSSGDNTSQNNKDDITKAILSSSKDKDSAIVLLHDGAGHGQTVDALPEIINGLKKQGYTFAALDNTVKPYCFGY